MKDDQRPAGLGIEMDDRGKDAGAFYFGKWTAHNGRSWREVKYYLDNFMKNCCLGGSFFMGREFENEK